ncbi:hypothetical protein SLE2022_097660 [Rubroshorea leprosula]
MAAVVVGHHMEEEVDHSQAWAAQDAYNREFENEDRVHFEVLFVAAVGILDFDEVVRLEGKDLCSYYPGN